MLTFGCLNILRSLSPLKLDDLLTEFRDCALDVLLMCETWHDSDSVTISRLRSDGFTVVERARPRRVPDSFGTNHGGVAIVAAAGVRMSAVDVGLQPLTFEFVAAHVSSGSASCVVVDIYCPGSAAATTDFFAEFVDLLDRLSTYTVPLVLAGDVNIRLERTSDSETGVH